MGFFKSTAGMGRGKRSLVHQNPSALELQGPLGAQVR